MAVPEPLRKDDGAVLVTGGTGLVGSRLTRALADAGRAVRVASRNPDATAFGDGVEGVAWNGRSLDPAALFRLGALVHLAGEPVFAGPLTEKRRRRIRASRIESTRALVAAMSELPEADRPGCFVCASAVGFYGSRGDKELPEEAGAGAGFLAEVCRDWEEAARGAAELGVRTVSLRIGIVLSRDGGALPQLARPFRLGLGGRLGNGRQWFPWIHIDDLVGLVRAILDTPRWEGAVNAVSPGCVTNAELTKAVGRVLRRPALLPVPAFLLRTLLGDLSDELLGSRRVVPRAALTQGFAFAHPTLATALEAELG